MLSLHEFESVPYLAMGDDLVRGLERATREAGVPLFRFSRSHLQAQRYVGTVHVGGQGVQVLPKIYPDEAQNLSYLVFLLGYTRRLPLTRTGAADHGAVQGSLLEIWIRDFATELNRALLRDRRSAYVEVEERTGFVRGKLLVERMGSGQEVLSGWYPCRYEVFTDDHLLNRVLRFCNRLLLTVTSVGTTIQLLRENDSLLDGVADVVVQASDLDRIHLNRLNRSYQPLLDFCRLLLTRSTIDFRSGRIAQATFMFDMGRLFEEFVAEFLRRHHANIKLDGGRRLVAVEPQQFLGRLFGEFRMNVDLRLTDEAGRTILLDTKYKVLDPAERHQGLAQADFYQMYAYARAGKAEYDEIVLLYPQTQGIAKTFIAGKVRLHVRSFDPRRIWSAASGEIDVTGTIAEMQRALLLQ